ncbi:hypothetical protein BGW38_000055 [Lunasporangiospora selenospora]|uniref:Uncharacterized protein n=1 Tax=Lunasporangiospora selenospora TaxID=979761 RepID=A0A9P6KF37_9FUNG|nr:hypothetical protein BGW38_000055 [Lunasporangiospora selenospora]
MLASISSTTVKRLIVFDFDWTLIETDSDHWVFEHLCEELYQEQLKAAGKVQWTDLQQRLLGELFKRGISKDDIVSTLSSAPFAPEMIKALQLMKATGAELYILSDANTVYIETILKAHNILQLFSGIITNPAAFDERGRLNVVRFHGLDKMPHGCPLPCQPNLCKGQELQKLIDSKAWDQVVYMGDSTNDFCPSTRLGSNDVVLARANLLLEHEIRQNPQLVQARVIYWSSAKDVLHITETILDSPLSSPTPSPSSSVSEFSQVSLTEPQLPLSTESKSSTLRPQIVQA